MPGKKSKPTRRQKKGAGFTEGAPPITDEQVAMVWTLLEEGLSRRGIAQEMGISVSSVLRILAKDATRVEDLRAAQREARSMKWRKIEDLGLDETIGWLEESKKARTGKTKASEKTAMVPGFLRATRHAAETATKTVELLTGGVTDRIGHAETTNDVLDSAEAIITRAIELGIEDQLPPKFREEIQRRKAAAALE